MTGKKVEKIITPVKGKTGLYLINGTKDGDVACLDANYSKGLSPSDIRKKRGRRTHIIEEMTYDKKGEH